MDRSGTQPAWLTPNHPVHRPCTADARPRADLAGLQAQSILNRSAPLCSRWTVNPPRPKSRSNRTRLGHKSSATTSTAPQSPRLGSKSSQTKVPDTSMSRPKIKSSSPTAARCRGPTSVLHQGSSGLQDLDGRGQCDHRQKQSRHQPTGSSHSAMCFAAVLLDYRPHRNTDSKMRSYDGQKFGFIQHPVIVNSFQS